MKICQLCKSIDSDFTEHRGMRICFDCYLKIFGKYPDAMHEGYDRQYKNNGLVFWIKADKIVHGWMDGGVTALPKTYEGLPVESLPQIIVKLNTYMSSNTRLCSTCGMEITRRQQALRHFAGVYCPKCALKYKKENGQICLICGQEHWACTC